MSCPDAVVKVVFPTAKMARQTMRLIYKVILADCPKEMLPKWNNMDGEYRFPNGSIVSLAGCEDGNEENLRGSKADLVLFDECGFIRNLEYAARSILAPMLMTTGGWMLYASTPPVSGDHDAVEIYRTLQSKGAAFTRTVYDNVRISDRERDAFFEDERGMLTLEQYKQTVAFRREYLAEFITDTTRAVVPEWNDARAKVLVEEVQRPEHFDAYTSLDVGWRDGMGAVFGYWDFLEARLVIEDEMLLFQQTIRVVADEIREKERSLWGDKKPYLRVADNDLLTIHDLSDNGLVFVPTAKDEKELQVNQLRQWVASGKIRIHPRCKHLVKQLYTTVWNTNRTSFERNKSGHGDLLDSLIYLCRNVRRDRNPFPSGWGLTPPGPNTLRGHEGGLRPMSPTGKAVLSIFGGKRTHHA